MKNHEIRLYDEIVSEKYKDWEGDAHGFDPNDMNAVLQDAEEGDVVNIYVNSPGGSVFSAVAMCSDIKRARSRGVKVDAYVDGIAASAASFLIMACDNVYMYDGSMLMIHKPWNFCIGNANDFLKAAEELESIENGTCMPLYKSKLKGEEEELKALMAKESWLSAKESRELFDIVLIDEGKDVKSVMTTDVIAKYRYQNVPDQLIVRDKEEEKPAEPVDYSEYEERINKLGGRR